MAVTSGGVLAAAAIGGVIMGADNAKKQAKAQAEAAKAAAHSSVEQIEHLSPVESFAMGVEGFTGAQAWQEMQGMARNQMAHGFAADQFAYGGAPAGQAAMQTAANMQGLGAGFERESEYAAYDLLRKSKNTVMAQIQHLGIDDGSGRNPYGVKLNLDEFIALQRQKDPSQHIANGTSLTDDPTPEEIMGAAKMANPAAADGNPAWAKRYELLNKIGNDPGLSGETLRAMEQTDPANAEAINYWKSQGVIDAQLNVNQGQLLENYEKFQMSLVENRTMQPMSPDQMTQYKDLYTQAATKQIDPKTVKIEDLGDGIQRTTILNADGKTPATSFLSGSMKLPNGQTVDNVSFMGASRRDWAQYQGVADKTGKLFSEAFNIPAEMSAPKMQGHEPYAMGSEAPPPKPQGYGGASLSESNQNIQGKSGFGAVNQTPFGSGNPSEMSYEQYTQGPPVAPWGPNAAPGFEMGGGPMSIPAGLPPGYDPGLAYMGGGPQAMMHQQAQSNMMQQMMMQQMMGGGGMPPGYSGAPLKRMG